MPSPPDVLRSLGVNTEARATPVTPEVVPAQPSVAAIEAADLNRRQAEGEGFWSLTDRAVRVDGLTHSLLAPEVDFPLDPEFNPVEYLSDPAFKERIDALGVTDDEEVGSILGEATSLEHFDHLLSNLEQTRDDERVLAENGAKGLAARVTTAFLDPTELAIGAIPVVGQAGKVSKLRAAIQAATVVGATNASIEAALATENPYRDGNDVLFAGLTGAALGGGLGALLTPARRAEYNRLVNQAADDIVDEDLANIVHRMAGTEPADPVTQLTRIDNPVFVDGDLDIDQTLAGLPPLAHGFTRVFRASSPTEGFLDVFDPNKLTDFTAPPGRAGNFFTDDLGYADYFRDAYNANRDASISFIDVPTSQLTEFQTRPGEYFFDPDALDYAPLGVAGESAGAAQRVLDEEGLVLRQPTAPLAEGPAPTFKWGWLQSLQQNYIGQLFHNGTEATRRYASRILEGGLLADRTQARSFTAEGAARNMQQVMTTRFYRESLEDFKEWANRNGYSALRRESGTEAGERFYTEVTRALRGETEVDPAALRAAPRLRNILNDMHEMAAKAELAGFVDAEPLPNFVPRMFDEMKVAKAFDDIDEQVIANWFREALLSAQDELEDAAAQTLANGFTRAIRNRAILMEDVVNHGLPTADLDQIRDLLAGLVDEAELDDIVESIRRINRPSTDKAGKVNHGRQRLRIDETTRLPVRRKDGEAYTFSIEDLTISDARKTIPRYIQTMSGHIGLAQHAGIRGEADVNKILKEMAEQGAPKAEQERMKEAINLVRGYSIERNPYSGLAQFSRASASADYVRLGGSFGAAQLPELGNIIGEAGITTFLRSIPEYRSFLRRAADGKLENELLQELEDFVAPGTDFIRSPATGMFDEQGLGYRVDTRAQRFLAKTDAPLQRAGRFTSIMSGMAPINAMLERMATVEVANNWARQATGRRGVQVSRLRAAGISAEMQERVFDQIRRHTDFNEAGRVKQINFDRWDDFDARDTYRLALDRERSNVIQRNDIGNTGRYIHTPLGRMLTRFMTFMLNSINKQLLRGVHHRDITTFVSWSSSMFLASLVYVGQTALDYAGDDKERKERLSPDRIAAAAFARAGAFAIIPPIVDSSLALASMDQIFNKTRTSGLGTSLVTSNPTITGVQDLLTTAALPARLVQSDYRFSQTDADRMIRLLPFQRFLGVKSALNAITSDLPESSTQ